MSKRHIVSYTQRQIDAPFWWGLVAVLALLLLSSCKASQHTEARGVSSVQLAVDRNLAAAWHIADTTYTYSLANPSIAYGAPVGSSLGLEGAAVCAGSNLSSSTTSPVLIPSQVVIRHAEAGFELTDSIASVGGISSEAVECSSRQSMPLTVSRVHIFALVLLLCLVVVSIALAAFRVFR